MPNDFNVGNAVKQLIWTGVIVARISELASRPMLLEYVDDLVGSPKPFAYLFEVYEALVEAWIVREQEYVADQKALRLFSELLAADLFLKRQIRQQERIPGVELEPLAKAYGINLDSWRLRARALLNRDASGTRWQQVDEARAQRCRLAQRFLAARAGVALGCRGPGSAGSAVA
jgi:hypothetical protein